MWFGCELARKRGGWSGSWGGKKRSLVYEEETSKAHLLAPHGFEWPCLSGCSHACISLRRCARCEDMWLQHMVPLIKAIGEVVCGIRGTTKDVKAARLFWASWSTGACCKERQPLIKWGYEENKISKTKKGSRDAVYCQCFNRNLKEKKFYSVTLHGIYIFVDCETVRKYKFPLWLFVSCFGGPVHHSAPPFSAHFMSVLICSIANLAWVFTTAVRIPTCALCCSPSQLFYSPILSIHF